MSSPSLAYRGRMAGILLMLLGLWGGLIPFVGPYFGFAFTPDRVWVFTAGRLWLSVVPGAAAFIGGLLVAWTDRAAVPGAFLAVLGGAWFIAGQPVTAATLTRVKATLRAALNAAIRSGYLAGHPAAHVQLPPARRPAPRSGPPSGSPRGRKPGSGCRSRCGPPRRPPRS